MRTRVCMHGIQLHVADELTSTCVAGLKRGILYLSMKVWCAIMLKRH